MTDKELWDAIHAHNRRQRAREQKLKIAEKKLQAIWNVLPDPSDIPTLPQLIRMLANIRKIRED